MANGFQPAGPTTLQRIGDIATALSGSVSPGGGPTLSQLTQQREAGQIEQEIQRRFDAGEDISPLVGQLATISPQRAQNVTNIFGNIGAQREQELFSDAQKAQGQLRAGNVEGTLRELIKRRDRLVLAGRDPSDTQDVIDALQADDIESAQQMLDATVQVGQQQGFLEAPRQQAATVGARKIFADGTILQSTPQGPRVFDATGKQLQGAEAQQAIQKANEFETKLQQERAAGRATGAETTKLSIKKAGEAFDKLQPVNKSIENIDSAIAAIDEGAKTGAFASKLPSIRTASVKLDQVRNELGLDVVGATTFGALSESELALALDTALPTKLPPQELRKWLEDKRAAQIKLRTGLEDAARFLSSGGTIGELVEQRRQERELEQQFSEEPQAAPQAQAEEQQPAPQQAQQIGRFQIRVK